MLDNNSDVGRYSETDQRLRQLGYRLTPQRMMLLSAIEEGEGHVSAEEIYARVQSRYPGMNISTVYRTLDLLTELGLVTRTDMGGGVVRYHPSNKGQHHHLVCQECGGVAELDDSILTPLRESLEEKYQFQADVRHFAIFGRCARCRR
ncbi:MAG: transcriptional repressor [Chloroflexi bacterium]|nr:transcriptional repressor [Chloroflexota bacterium]